MFKQLQNLVITARAARPDLPMLSTNVEHGAFSIVCFPNYGNGARSQWHKDLMILRDNLSINEAIAALENTNTL